MATQMKIRHKFSLKFCLTFLIAFAVYGKSLAENSHSNHYHVNHVCVDSPWAYDSLGKQVSAAFMTISTEVGMQDRLVSANAPVAKRTEIHEIVMKSGVMMMQPVSNLKVSSNKPLILKPRGLHIMLMELNQPLKAGTSIDLTLEFEEAGNIDMQLKILELGAQSPDQNIECK